MRLIKPNPWLKYLSIMLIFIMVFKPVIVLPQQNLSFEDGFNGWKSTNKKIGFNIDLNNANKGKACLKLLNGEIYQRIKTTSFYVIECSANTKLSDATVNGFSFLRFYNANNKLLLEYTDKLKNATDYKTTGFYTEAPFGTTYFTIGIHKNVNNIGCIYADDFNVHPHVGAPLFKKAPLCNVNQYMQPFWKSDTIYNETVLLYSENGKPASGKLLFNPVEVLSVKDFGLKTDFLTNKDYVLENNTITRTEHSKMPFRADTSFDTKNDLAWFNLQSQWVVATYTHHDKFGGPFPNFKGNKLPNTMAMLKAKLPLKIIAFGMSITRGLDVSGYDTVPPYMLTYVDLFSRQLKKIFGYNDIKMFNAGLPGSTVDWGADYASQYVNPVKPNLVIIDFGMNDFWRFDPQQFKCYIQTIINRVKVANPKAEFILLSNIKFDPDYIIPTDKYKDFYQNNLSGYNVVLKQMETMGIANLDMTTLSDYIYANKKAKDCLVNPLHPNDYLARWFAQGLVALLDEKGK